VDALGLGLTGSVYGIVQQSTNANSDCGVTDVLTKARLEDGKYRPDSGQ